MSGHRPAFRAAPGILGDRCRTFFTIDESHSSTPLVIDFLVVDLAENPLVADDVWRGIACSSHGAANSAAPESGGEFLSYINRVAGKMPGDGIRCNPLRLSA
jgi:hypothetical protein